MNRYEAVRVYYSQFSVKKMCQVLSVSESGYYIWRRNPESRRAKEEQELISRIREIYKEHNGFAGSPMIARDLRAEERFANVSENRVARLMKKHHIKCKIRKKYKKLQIPGIMSRLPRIFWIVILMYQRLTRYGSVTLPIS